MSYDQIVTLIGSVGFPIVCVFAMLYIFRQIIIKMEDSHKEELTKVTEAINNNTQVVSEMKNELEQLRNERK
jgi:hypothetical protein